MTKDILGPLRLGAVPSSRESMMRQELSVLEGLTAVSDLLRQVRFGDTRAGVWKANDLQW